MVCPGEEGTIEQNRKDLTVGRRQRVREMKESCRYRSRDKEKEELIAIIRKKDIGAGLLLSCSLGILSLSNGTLQ